MKRLTISMSDELFEKLGTIENKSLFIRKLIERELDALDNGHSDETMPWTEKFATLRDEVSNIANRLEMIESKFPGIDENVGNIPIHQETPQPSVNMLGGEETMETEQYIEDIHTPDFDVAQPMEATGEMFQEESESINDIQSETPEPELEKLSTSIEINTESEIQQSPLQTEPDMENLTPDTESLELAENETISGNEETAHETTLSEMVAEKIHQSEPSTNETDSVKLK
ncbi:MAG: hypothetical protein R2741_00450 [Methanolobus sp.]